MLDFSDGGKHLQTRSGLPVRIYGTDGEPRYPIHGAYQTSRGWCAMAWENTGECCGEGTHQERVEYSLIPKPAPPRTGECWLNVYASESGAMWTAGHSTKREAESSGDTNCIARIRVELIEGRFDS